MRIQPPNYTQAPNELFDEWLPLLGLAELKVLMVIIRKTFGWHKVRDRISLSQLQQITGLERRHVCSAIKSLEGRRLITKIVVGNNGEQQTFYELFIDDSNNFDQCPKDTPTSVLKTPTKETLTKERYRESASPPPSPSLSLANAAQDSRPSAPPIKEIPREAKEMAEELLKKVKAIHPKLKEPNLDKWAKEMDLLHRADKREWSEIRDMIKWAFEDAFWVKIIQSPEGLRRNWDKMAVKQANVNNKGVAVEKNRTLANEVKQHLIRTNRSHLLWIGNNRVDNTKTGDSVLLDLNPETFQDILFKWFDLTRG